MIRRVFGAVALAAVLAAPAGAASCRIPVGHPVVLTSSELDPDVFVWDSRQRVIGYAAGLSDDPSSVLAHSLLAKSGTHAVVMLCNPGVVQWKYAVNREDAVKVRITDGPRRGRAGWVASEDVHSPVSEPVRYASKYRKNS